MNDFLAFLIGLFLFIFFKSRTDDLGDQIKEIQKKLGIKSLSDSQENALEPVAKAAVLPAENKKTTAPKEVLDPVQVVPAEDRSDDLEFKVGSKIFTGIGVVAVVCAVGFFLRYAFENDLINKPGRVALGVIAGLVLVGIGEYTRKRFSTYGQALTGGGLGVLYLSFYAAFSFYGIMAQPAAFFAMVLVTAAGILLALRQNSMGLAMFAQLGGFLTPLLINSGRADAHILFLYILLLDLAVFLLAFYKLWQPLALVSFVGTALTYLYWFGSYNSSQFAVAQGYLSLFFGIFLGILLIQYYVKKSPENSWDLMLATLNPVFYFSLSYSIIHPLYPDFMGLFTIMLGALYCSLSAVVGGNEERASLFRHFLLTVGFVLLAIAVPVQFDGKWIVAFWSAEALAFIATGFRMKFTLYRALGHLLFFAAIFRLVVFESGSMVGDLALLNARLLNYVLLFMALVFAAFVYRRKKQDISQDERPVFSLLALECAFVGLTGLSLEIKDFFGGYWYPILWSAGGLAAGWLSFKFDSLALRCVTYITFGMAVLHLLFSDSYVSDSAYVPLLNTRVLAFAASAAIIRTFLWLIRQNSKKLSADEYGFFHPALFISFHFLLVWLMSAEIISFCNQLELRSHDRTFNFENLKNVLLSVAWTIYGAVLLMLGILKKAVYERFLAIALFAIVIVKVFLVDTASLDNLYRFYSFITLGCILLLAGYLYYRYQDRIREFVKGN